MFAHLNTPHFFKKTEKNACYFFFAADTIYSKLLKRVLQKTEITFLQSKIQYFINQKDHLGNRKMKNGDY